MLLTTHFFLYDYAVAIISYCKEQARNTSVGGGPAGEGGGGSVGYPCGKSLKLGCKILHSGHFWPWSGEKWSGLDRLLRPEEIRPFLGRRYCGLVQLCSMCRQHCLIPLVYCIVQIREKYIWLNLAALKCMQSDICIVFTYCYGWLSPPPPPPSPTLHIGLYSLATGR